MEEGAHEAMTKTKPPKLPATTRKGRVNVTSTTKLITGFVVSRPEPPRELVTLEIVRTPEKAENQNLKARAVNALLQDAKACRRSLAVLKGRCVSWESAWKADVSKVDAAISAIDAFIKTTQRQTTKMK
jgi:hypothetical protein